MRTVRHYPRAWFIALIALVGLAGCKSCAGSVIPPEALVHHDIAIQYLNQGQCVEAEERCRLSLEFAPNFAHPHNCLRLVELHCRNNLDEAADHFKRAISANSDFVEAHNNLGVTFFRRKPPLYDEACDQYLAAIEINPSFLDGRENLGLCLMRRGVIAGAQKDIETRTELFRAARSHLIRLTELNPDNFNARDYLGFMDMLEERYEPAERNFRRCLEIDEENPVCAFHLGETYLRTARCNDAIPLFVSSLRSGDKALAPESRRQLATAYEECAKSDGAIKAFLETIKKDPGNPTHHYDLGSIYFDKGLFDRAVNEWENTIKLDSMYCMAYYRLAQHANKNLDSAATIRRCQDFVHCAKEQNRNESIPRWGEETTECKNLIRRLELE